MKNNYKLIAAIILASLSACSNKLNKQDSDRLANIERTAEDAKQKSAEALDESANARRAADKASAKADRIFKESQNK